MNDANTRCATRSNRPDEHARYEHFIPKINGSWLVVVISNIGGLTVMV